MRLIIAEGGFPTQKYTAKDAEFAEIICSPHMLSQIIVAIYSPGLLASRLLLFAISLKTYLTLEHTNTLTL